MAFGFGHFERFIAKQLLSTIRLLYPLELSLLRDGVDLEASSPVIDGRHIMKAASQRQQLYVARISR